MKSLWLTSLTLFGALVVAGESQASWSTWYFYCAQKSGKETWMEQHRKAQESQKALEKIDWVEYYKHNYRAPVFPGTTMPSIQWAVPNGVLQGPPIMPPPGGYPPYPFPYGYPSPYPH